MRQLTILSRGKLSLRGLPGLPLVTLIIIELVFLPACSHSPNVPIEAPKAAIINQLYTLQPNEAFISEVTQQLRDYGFAVDLYQGDEVTVELHKDLPSYGYKLVVFRSHSGLLGSEGKVTKRTCLFTNEPYSERRHVPEQLSDQLAKARIDKHHPWVFGIGDKFVTQSMEGRLDNTIMVMMGCSCLYLDDLATAFIDKGASCYLAWDVTVNLDYVDKATPYLVRQLCAEKATIRKAVTSTMNVVGPDPKYKAVLKYLPPSSGDKTLKELMK